MPWILVQVENDVWMYGGYIVDVSMNGCMYGYIYVCSLCRYVCMYAGVLMKWMYVWNMASLTTLVDTSQHRR
jgi:hypothetical protein